MHTYNEAIQWIHDRLQFGIKPGLERMEFMLAQLDNPERRIKAVHLAGTNGKGSTLSYMRYMLQEAGYEVGTFTSPYIEQFNERISVNGTPISDDEITKLVQIVKPVAEKLCETDLGEATEFEIITVMAIYYFGCMNPTDIVLFETGLGGRLDSTNVIHPLVTIITNIGQDHQHILGETVQEIAYEKGGIIKNGVPIITAIEQLEALEVITPIAKEKKAPLYVLGKEFMSEYKGQSEGGEAFSFSCAFGSLPHAELTMKGKHQVKNASLALMAMHYLKTYFSILVDKEQMEVALHKTFWLGRFEKVQDNPTVIIDGAHNPEGVKCLVDTLQTHYCDKRITIMFSAVSDKKIGEMVPMLEELADKMVFTSFDFYRALPAETLAEYASKEHVVYGDFKVAIDETLAEIGENEICVITGSLYFISEVRKYMKK
ncbi:bifunctional folylpolyglutamate synthase/dihydrofolate synthase [Priestia taiwanensis]|uniref:Dihydrofolate synthase/folylpolyglutamate synthase n=1 Tax=Priestia taiwanensis TaxID=1347902 RepID=A0A917EQK2_9BACI|nr:folylpolyglutamate synthase/dihydrofolate synthase family protein [Priestia taiwanensis]MBM7363588.1 dihydrofolate synthase/folylpolyglutamate synthase [Priestia taiwanensis]GGE75831.1 bifunctional folylpolyglutamate synthase/dihydrofolate synthase [Priestia taiwanensis]